MSVAANSGPVDREPDVAVGGRARDDAVSDGVVYVTRKFPPSTGGMQLLASQLHAALREHGDSRLVALGRSQRHLCWFLPWAATRVTGLVLTRRARRVVCGDPVMLLALLPVILLLRVPTAVIVHGLDLTWSARGYQRVLEWVLRRVDRVVAISDATKEVALGLGIGEERLRVLNPGLPMPAADHNRSERTRTGLLEQLDLHSDAFILVTVGRLVARKGVGWFIRHVMPTLPTEAVYVVVGAGPELETIRSDVRKAGLEDRVRLLGRVDPETRDRLLTTADVFVMPNVPVPDDMEGFGLVAVEAAMAGCLVVASRLEGIRDAVTEGATGYLCTPGKPEEFIDRIKELMADRDGLRETASRFQHEARTRHSFERLVAELPESLGLEQS